MRLRAGNLMKYFLFILPVVFWSLHGDLAQSKESYLTKEGRKIHPKIESVLSDLKERHLQGRATSREFTNRHHIKMDEEDRVTVFFYPEAGRSKDTIDTETLKAYGCEILKSGDAVVKAKVPISMLDLIADQVEGISFVRLPNRPLAQKVSEGVGLTGASSYHLFGYDGQNVKVAIIDLGFANLADAVANGILPSSVVKIDCTGTACEPTDYSSESEMHGTAVAEIVHEMAPEAELYLIKVGDELDLKDAKDYCIANGVRVINHSVGWYMANFYDGKCYFDNPVCSADHAYKSGILWVNSAGNDAQLHYEATFKDTDGDRLHNVTKSSNYISIHAEAGDAVIAPLTWDAWPVTDQDFDLLLYDDSFTLVAASMGAQTGTQTPVEEVFYVVPASGTYYLAVKKYSATTNPRFHLFTFYHDLNPYVASSSLVSPSDAAGVLSVAAIDWEKWGTGPQEDFSSQGPTSDGRMKPEISGPDGNWSYVYDTAFGEEFFGTSASSPHVVGAAALILSNVPTLTVSQLWDALTSTAIDMGAPGQDPIYGFGRLNLSAIYVYPTAIDFGDVVIGNPTEEVITILNIGSPNLVIENISSPSDHSYEIIEDHCSGRALVLGESCTFEARFFPGSPGTAIAHFDISSNDTSRNPVAVSLAGKGIFDITLLSPTDGTSFTPCSVSFPPTFSWGSVVSPGSFEIEFSTDSTFADIPVRIQVSGDRREKGMSSSQWKKILQITGANGGLVYWRVAGTLSEGPPVISDLRSFSVSEPVPVENPEISPVAKSQLPTLGWQNHCNNHFKVWFGADPLFARKRTLNFRIPDPSTNGGIFSTELTDFRWQRVRELVRDVSGSTIYWYVESRDSLNRRMQTELMSFELTD